MAMQMMLLGSSGNSRITAETQRVEVIRPETAVASLGFLPNGQQFTERNSSMTITGNWVTPAFTSNLWEVRATLDSGISPSGILGVWLPLSVARKWTLTAEENEIAECFLSFEFRRIGETSAEALVSGSSIYAERLDIL